MSEFKLEGLPKGMASTIGNFIRRSFFEEYRKWDVVGFRVEGLHQFSVIPNSTTVLTSFNIAFKDMLLNLHPELDAKIEDALKGMTKPTAGSPIEKTHIELEDNLSMRVCGTYTGPTGELCYDPLLIVSVHIDSDAITSKTFSKWFTYERDVEFCKMLEPTKLYMQVFLRKVHGVISQEENYAALMQADIIRLYTTTVDEVVFMPSSNQGPISVSFSVQEGIAQDTLVLSITPENTQVFKAVTSCVTSSITRIIQFMRGWEI